MNTTRDAGIVERYLRGEDSVSIGRDVGLTGDRVRQILEREGISRRKDYRVKFDHKAIEFSYSQGNSVAEVAKSFACSPSTVRTILKDHGWDLEQKPSVDPSEIVRRYKNGETQAEIGRALGVSQTTISKYVRIAGLTYKDRSKSR